MLTVIPLAAALLAAEPVSTAVALASEPAPLHGTLLAPAGKPDAVAVIVAGSGPTDRDGNSPLGVSASTYRLLAEGLAERGIATIRYDKRGIAESATSIVNEAALRFEHLADDAEAWAAFAARNAGLPCAWLIGHSEGALVAQVAAQNPEWICGLVLLSPVGEPAGEVIRDQLTVLPEGLQAEARRVIVSLESGRTTDTPSELAALFRPSVQPYLISYLALDPAELIATYDGPILLATGDNDLQVSTIQAERLHRANPRARLEIFNGVNHVLKLAPTDRAGNIAVYANPDLPLAPGVIEVISDFIRAPR